MCIKAFIELYVLAKKWKRFKYPSTIEDIIMIDNFTKNSYVTMKMGDL